MAAAALTLWHLLYTEIYWREAEVEMVERGILLYHFIILESTKILLHKIQDWMREQSNPCHYFFV